MSDIDAGLMILERVRTAYGNCRVDKIWKLRGRCDSIIAQKQCRDLSYREDQIYSGDIDDLKMNRLSDKCWSRMARTAKINDHI